MKWIYGKQDWKTLERGQENCWLMTNGLGGFSSMTMIGSASRNDHALLMGCLKAPNYRYNLVHRLSESVELEEKEYVISSQEFADGTSEEGYEYLSEFSYEDTPVWRFLVRGVQIRKEAAMEQRSNTVAVCYEISNRSSSRCTLSVTPFFQFTPKGTEPEEEQEFCREKNQIKSNGITLHFQTNGEIVDFPERTEVYFYRYDACDGRRDSGRAKACHRICLSVEAGESACLEVIYSLDPISQSFESLSSQLKEYRRQLEKKAGFRSEIASFLAKSADQFISKRDSTGKETILAGFPFFEDWGRDTMIALPGICITTGRYQEAREILRTFAENEREGLMPNLFPEGNSEPMYNTVDAALLFINCVYLYYEKTQDLEFVREMYPVMKRIIQGYRQGTLFGIHMDEDGLILAGEGLDQVTWMDVRVGEILPTPRHGKPVEINAYWYNALCIMSIFAGKFGDEKEEYENLAKKAQESFRKKFWMEKKHCLRDLVSGTSADEQIRCNQIWAVSMPFTMLEEEQEKQVVEIVFEKLYTPYGLRTLDEEDPQFHGTYGGPVLERDMAYHQGTVWTFPLGGYYLAYLKVNGESQKAIRTVTEQLEVLESALREGCIGQLPEIYDGKKPTSSKGCFAQAWSVGEILRVYEKVEEK
ncbi:MAG TPA: amylo-alpha-1,6-glucosidase [Candidatus Blautia intestinigallinarum]|nr:amylo-alpha-1,6-glucosidase [Candidatus Blautia intestinigallinarum]